LEQRRLKSPEIREHGSQGATWYILKKDEEATTVVLVAQATDDVPVPQVVADLQLMLQLFAILPVLLFILVDPGHLHSKDLARCAVLGFIHAPICALANLSDSVKLI